MQLATQTYDMKKFNLQYNSPVGAAIATPALQLQCSLVFSGIAIAMSMPENILIL